MKHLFNLFLLLLALLLPATAAAHDFEVDGIYYNRNGNEATVTYKGTYSSQYSDEYSGSVTIPASVTYGGNTYSVTSIGSSAFSGCTGLTSVTIPNSVTSIGSSAFSGCTGLTSVTIPNSVTSIGNSAFRDCSGLTSINIPNSVTTIDYYAFYGCIGLTGVYISDLESWCKISFASGESNPLCYAKHLFLNGEEIKDLVIPNTISSIGNSTFLNCI